MIPKIAATARVWPNVDPLDRKDFLPKLQNGVAHAKGSVFPGMEGNVYLFAHSTDNFGMWGGNAVFYLLKDLTPRDDVAVYFENTRYNYKVERTVIKDPSDVDLLVNSRIPGQEQLILQNLLAARYNLEKAFRDCNSAEIGMGLGVAAGKG